MINMIKIFIVNTFYSLKNNKYKLSYVYFVLAIFGAVLPMISNYNFALGYFSGPFISGRVLDIYGNASLIWLNISILCFLLATLIFKKKF